MLKNRTLASGLFLFIALGFGLYGGVFLFPLFAQGILNFTPTETGLVMMPGGIATGISALVCGALLNGAKPKVDARILIGVGVTLFAVSMWIMGHLSTAAGVDDVRFALLVRGFGLGLLFVPINNVVYASIKPQEAQQASGLINLARQLGGAFGIAVLANYLNHHTETHRVDLVAFTVPGGPMTEQRIGMMAQAFIARGMDALHAHEAALQVLNGQLQRQATMLGFNDAWMLVLIVFVLVSPAILLLRRPSPSASPVAAEAH